MGLAWYMHTIKCYSAKKIKQKPNAVLWSSVRHRLSQGFSAPFLLIRIGDLGLRFIIQWTEFYNLLGTESALGEDSSSELLFGKRKVRKLGGKTEHHFWF